MKSKQIKSRHLRKSVRCLTRVSIGLRKNSANTKGLLAIEIAGWHHATQGARMDKGSPAKFRDVVKPTSP